MSLGYINFSFQSGTILPHFCNSQISWRTQNFLNDVRIVPDGRARLGNQPFPVTANGLYGRAEAADQVDWLIISLGLDVEVLSFGTDATGNRVRRGTEQH